MTKSLDCFVYMLTSPSGKSYIGVSIDPDRRWRDHKYATNRGSSLAVHRALRKHGPDGFKRQILFQASGDNSQAICFRAEKVLIKLHDTLHPKGYNLLEGGDTAGGHSKVTATKHRGKILKALSKPDVRKRMSEVATERLKDHSVRQNISNKLKQYYKDTPDSKQKLYDRSFKREVICVETGQLFKAVSDAARWIQETSNPKAQKSKISQAAKGKTKTAYGYTWKYTKENSYASQKR